PGRPLLGLGGLAFWNWVGTAGRVLSCADGMSLVILRTSSHNGVSDRMRYEPEHKQQTRAKILRVASRAIRARGPHRVAVADVMARAGLTHGGFYAHFKSKDDLVAAAIEAMFATSR